MEEIDRRVTDYYAFGSPMPGRNFNSPNYRYGFNGKEKDSEIKGEGNSLDFGARIYDPRLGRWLSVDPAFKSQPGWSPYKAFLDNPNFYTDPDGGQEYDVIRIVNEKDGSSIEFKKWKSDDVVRKGIEVAYDAFGNIVNKTVWADKLNVTTIVIGSNGELTGSYAVEAGDNTASLSVFRESKTFAKWNVNADADNASLEGGGDSQFGGWHLTSKTGGESPTKAISKSTPETKDVGLLLDVLGAHQFGELSGISKRLVDVINIVQKINNAPEDLKAAKEWRQFGDTEITKNYYGSSNVPFYLKVNKDNKSKVYGTGSEQDYDKRQEQKKGDNLEE